MLDVHPAHHAANSWRDFFIHIATHRPRPHHRRRPREQTVEYFHHLLEVADAREALRHPNTAVTANSTPPRPRSFAASHQSSKNLAIFLYLQQHPGAPQEDCPISFTGSISISIVDSAWKSAQQSMCWTLCRRMCSYTGYNRLSQTPPATIDLRSALYEARSFTQIDPDPSHLSTAAHLPPDRTDEQGAAESSPYWRLRSVSRGGLPSSRHPPQRHRSDHSHLHATRGEL